MLRFLTAGESHGPCLTVIVEGLPSGLAVDTDLIDRDLRRRQGGYGRGGRQRIERDRVQVLSGTYRGQTIGSPITLLVPNRDYENWKERDVPPWRKPRPGHADLAGSVRYGLDDLRLVAERASARETAARVAAGGLAKCLLSRLAVNVGSYVESLGGVNGCIDGMALDARIAAAAESDVYCPDPDVSHAMRERIDAAREAGDSLGGTFVVVATHLPVGLGSHIQWDRRLDGQLAQAVMSIQAVKGVEVGAGFRNAELPGTQVHDPIRTSDGRIERRTNRAGGIEGGITNGSPVMIRAAMKPIPTTVTPIPTVDLRTGEATQTEYSRSDVCAVPAASVVGEAMVALVLARAAVERYGDDLEALARGFERDRIVDHVEGAMDQRQGGLNG